MDKGFARYAGRLRAAGLSRRDALAGFGAAAGAGRRFEYARALLRRHGLLPAAVHLPRDYVPALLDDDDADRERRLGNARYAAGDYADAAACYTRSALMCRPGTVRHAYALANRSAAMYRAADYRRCADDVRRAVRSGYPAAAVHKLHERAGDAERMLGRGRRARGHYAECLRRADSADAALDDEARRRLRARVAVSVAGCDDGPPAAVEPAEAADAAAVDWRQPAGGRHDDVPALSRRLRLGRAPATGRRGVYAACDIDPGDVVAVDEPYVSASIHSCHYPGCLAMKTAGIIPCPNCLMAYYCNEECLEKDFQDGHDIECIIMFSIKTLSGNSNLNSLALRWFLKECTKMGIEEYCSVLNNIDKTKVDPEMVGFDENGQFKSNNFFTAYSMKNCANKTSLEVLFFMQCIAVEILEYLMLSGFKIPDRYVATAGASLTHMLSILDYNCQKISIYNPCITFNKRSLPIAYALYPSISLFNHSCDPNVYSSGILSEKTRILRAIQPIPKGSQLFVSYGVVFHTENKNSRLSYCIGNFKFKCTCQPCLENWPCGRFIPNRISSLNLLYPKMADIITLECSKFLEFIETTKPDEFHKHLNYLYSFNKLIFTNVKRPFKLYENCLAMLYDAHIENDLQSLTHFFSFSCLDAVSF